MYCPYCHIRFFFTHLKVSINLLKIGAYIYQMWLEIERYLYLDNYMGSTAEGIKRYMEEDSI